MMKNWSKVLTIIFCTICLVTASVMGTIAVLTARTETVTNTFTVGNITISLDESKVNELGKVVDQDGNPIAYDGDGNPLGEAPRVMANEYKLFEGETYTKDPVVHVGEGSEPCYLFVMVNNEIEDIEADNGVSIDDQILNNGWQNYTGVDGLYWTTHEGDEKLEYPVFQMFTIGSNIENFQTYQGKKIEITAYAVQMTGCADEEEAWEFAAPSKE